MKRLKLSSIINKKLNMPANGYTYTMHLAFGERALSAILRWLPIKHGKHRILDKFFPKPWIERSQPVVVSIRGFDVVIVTGKQIGRAHV